MSLVPTRISAPKQQMTTVSESSRMMPLAMYSYLPPLGAGEAKKNGWKSIAAKESLLMSGHSMRMIWKPGWTCRQFHTTGSLSTWASSLMRRKRSSSGGTVFIRRLIRSYRSACLQLGENRLETHSESCLPKHREPSRFKRTGVTTASPSYTRVSRPTLRINWMLLTSQSSSLSLAPPGTELHDSLADRY